jgi:uncharacterized membrane protein
MPKNMPRKEAKTMEQPRWKSWVVWLTLLPVLILLGDTYGLWDVIHMSSDTFTKLFTAIGAALVAFGILNNPKDPSSF